MPWILVRVYHNGNVGQIVIEIVEIRVINQCLTPTSSHWRMVLRSGRVDHVAYDTEVWKIKLRRPGYVVGLKTSNDKVDCSARWVLGSRALGRERCGVVLMN